MKTIRTILILAAIIGVSTAALLWIDSSGVFYTYPDKNKYKLDRGPIDPVPSAASTL